jgi:hypothetical protein
MMTWRGHWKTRFYPEAGLSNLMFYIPNFAVACRVSMRFCRGADWQPEKESDFLAVSVDTRLRDP